MKPSTKFLFFLFCEGCALALLVLKSYPNSVVTSSIRVLASRSWHWHPPTSTAVEPMLTKQDMNAPKVLVDAKRWMNGNAIFFHRNVSRGDERAPLQAKGVQEEYTCSEREFKLVSRGIRRRTRRWPTVTRLASGQSTL